MSDRIGRSRKFMSIISDAFFASISRRPLRRDAALDMIETKKLINYR